MGSPEVDRSIDQVEALRRSVDRVARLSDKIDQARRWQARSQEALEAELAGIVEWQVPDGSKAYLSSINSAGDWNVKFRVQNKDPETGSWTEPADIEDKTGGFIFTGTQLVFDEDSVYVVSEDGSQRCEVDGSSRYEGGDRLMRFDILGDNDPLVEFIGSGMSMKEAREKAVWVGQEVPLPYTHREMSYCQAPSAKYRVAFRGVDAIKARPDFDGRLSPDMIMWESGCHHEEAATVYHSVTS